MQFATFSTIALLREDALPGEMCLKLCCYFQVKPDGIWSGADPNKAWNNAKSRTMTVENQTCCCILNDRD